MNNVVRTPEELEAAKVNRNFTEEDRICVMRSLMSSSSGRKFIWWVLSLCGIFRSQIGAHHVMAFNEGKRTVGLELFSLIQSDAECQKGFALSQHENSNKDGG